MSLDGLVHVNVGLESFFSGASDDEDAEDIELVSA